MGAGEGSALGPIQSKFGVVASPESASNHILIKLRYEH